jgi:hypothetical protein
LIPRVWFCLSGSACPVLAPMAGADGIRTPPTRPGSTACDGEHMSHCMIIS